MSNKKILIEWLKNDWNGENVRCSEIITKLDIGRKSWTNMRNDDQFINNLKDLEIEIKTIDGLGKSLYFITH